jgi:RecB family endonuclease NucS
LPSYWVDPTGITKLTRVKKAPKESLTEKLVAIYPKLLGHKRKIVWFWKRPNGPGDLFGFDAMGRFVVVEFKKK